MAKLNLSNIFRIILITSLLGQTSCSIFKRKVDYNTEIICPDGSNILIKFVRALDVKRAIQAAYDLKIKLRTQEGYTIFRLPDGRSFHLLRISPEKMLGCKLEESRLGVVDPSYVHIGPTGAK